MKDPNKVFAEYFIKKYHISHASVRFWMKIGLIKPLGKLDPKNRRSRFIFKPESTSAIIEQILALKKKNKTLAEIKKELIK